MSLVPDYDSSDNSSESDSNTEVSTSVETPVPQLPSPSFKLPTPNFKGNATNVDVQGSVFINPFLQEEAAKEAILEKHVKMVNTKSNVIVINGKRICWNYRKGRCRFGHNCKYAHDSDIQKTEEELQAEKEAAKATSVICQSTHLSQSSTTLEPAHQNFDQTEEESLLNKKKRKRPGLTQGLVPGKKVMKSYTKHKV